VFLQLNPVPTRSALFVAVLLVASGCGDLNTAPPVEIVAAETVPAVQFRGEILSLPRAVEAWGGSMALSEAVDEWKRSWELPGGEAERSRHEVRRAVAGILETSLEGVDLARDMEALDRTIRQAESLLGEGAPATLLSLLDGARADRDRAETALEGGDLESALYHILAAGDRLHALTPEGMTRELLAETDALLRRILDGDPYLEEKRRAERLLTGARDALEKGSGVLALKRAWYAAQLLDDLHGAERTDQDPAPAEGPRGHQP
jgi:hypothetical protein